MAAVHLAPRWDSPRGAAGPAPPELQLHDRPGVTVAHQRRLHRLPCSHSRANHPAACTRRCLNGLFRPTADARSWAGVWTSGTGLLQTMLCALQSGSGPCRLPQMALVRSSIIGAIHQAFASSQTIWSTSHVMVRFKNRYMLFEVCWKDGRYDDTISECRKPPWHAWTLMQAAERCQRRAAAAAAGTDGPLSSLAAEAALLATFRDSLQQNFGDFGLGCALASFQGKFPGAGSAPNPRCCSAACVGLLLALNPLLAAHLTPCSQVLQPSVQSLHRALQPRRVPTGAHAGRPLVSGPSAAAAEGMQQPNHPGRCNLTTMPAAVLQCISLTVKPICSFGFCTRVWPAGLGLAVPAHRGAPSCCAAAPAAPHRHRGGLPTGGARGARRGHRGPAPAGAAGAGCRGRRGAAGSDGGVSKPVGKRHWQTYITIRVRILFPLPM